METRGLGERTLLPFLRLAALRLAVETLELSDVCKELLVRPNSATKLI